MPRKIRIVATPEGFAPQCIREDWLGVELTLAEYNFDGFRLENQDGDNYEVETSVAVDALLDAQKNNAAEYWAQFVPGNLFFKKEVCELL